MSENQNEQQKSISNSAIEAVASLINALDIFPPIRRGALGTGFSFVFEVSPSSPSEVFLNKNKVIPLDLTFNAKGSDLYELSNGLNLIHESLTMAKSFPSGDDWKIIDIETETEPQVIGREENNDWLMASAIIVTIETKKGE